MVRPRQPGRRRDRPRTGRTRPAAPTPDAAPRARSRPAGRRRGRTPPTASSHRTVPPACTNSVRSGSQPPDTAQDVAGPPIAPRRPPTSTAVSAASPWVPVRDASATTSTPRSVSSATSTGGGRCRASARSGTATPAATRSSAVVVAAVVGRGDDDPLAGDRRVPVEVRADRARQHHARPVVAGEHERPLLRTGREHDARGADVPQPLAGRVRGRVLQVVRAALVDEQVAVVVEPDGGRAGEDRDVRQRRELRRAGRRPRARAGSRCDSTIRRAPAGRRRAARAHRPPPRRARPAARPAAAHDERRRRGRTSCRRCRRPRLAGVEAAEAGQQCARRDRRPAPRWWRAASPRARRPRRARSAPRRPR